MGRSFDKWLITPRRRRLLEGWHSGRISRFETVEGHGDRIDWTIAHRRLVDPVALRARRWCGLRHVVRMCLGPTPTCVRSNVPLDRCRAMACTCSSNCSRVRPIVDIDPAPHHVERCHAAAAATPRGRLGLVLPECHRLQHMLHPRTHSHPLMAMEKQPAQIPLFCVDIQIVGNRSSVNKRMASSRSLLDQGSAKVVRIPSDWGSRRALFSPTLHRRCETAATGT